MWMARIIAVCLTKISRINRLCRVIVTAVALCALPYTAQAQLRSFRAISYITLAPPPAGLEQLYQDLAQ
jgi:hypothetical protein